MFENYKIAKKSYRRIESVARASTKEFYFIPFPMLRASINYDIRYRMGKELVEELT